MDELKKCVEVLVKNAAETKSAVDSLQFSQAACNAANAIRILVELKSERL